LPASNYTNHFKDTPREAALALPRLLLFFYAFCRDFHELCHAHSLSKNDAQGAAPVFGQRNPRDFNFGG
jgi:hypothetical protein